jgi:hypothetical protein
MPEGYVWRILQLTSKGTRFFTPEQCPIQANKFVTGSAKLKSKGRPLSCTDPDRTMNILAKVRATPLIATRRMNQEEGRSNAHTTRILKLNSCHTRDGLSIKAAELQPFKKFLEKLKLIIWIKICIMIPNESFCSEVILIFLEIFGSVAALRPLCASCRCIVPT